MAVIDVVKKTFASRLGAKFTNDAGAFSVEANHILLKVEPYGVHSIDVDTFASMYGDLFPSTLAFGAKPTVYDKLVGRITPSGGIPDSTWKEHFDRMKTGGIVF